MDKGCLAAPFVLAWMAYFLYVGVAAIWTGHFAGEIPIFGSIVGGLPADMKGRDAYGTGFVFILIGLAPLLWPLSDRLFDKIKERWGEDDDPS
jgi:hypothetical protein